MWMKWIHFLPLNSYQCTRGLRTRIRSWLEILLSGFAPSGEAMFSRVPPGRKGHSLWMQCPSSSVLLSSFDFPGLWDFIGTFICFSLFDLECGSFIHVVGNIYVAGDLVVSLSFLPWLFTVFVSAGLFYWALPFFKSLLCCKADFFSNFWSPLSGFFYGPFTNFTVAVECLK